MQLNILRSVRVAFVLFIALALLGGGVGEGVRDWDKVLNGDYEYTLSTDCVNSADGFGSDFELLSDGDLRASNARGTITYDGAGEGTIDATAITHFHLNSRKRDIPVGKFTATCSLTYTVEQDMSFPQQTDCHIGSTKITGIEWRGQIVDNGQILLIADTDRNVEDIRFQSGATRYGICGRSGFAIKLAPSVE